MLRKKVEIDGREVEFKASAAVPRIYRMKFRRDLFMDLQKIAKSVKKKGKKEKKPKTVKVSDEKKELFDMIYGGLIDNYGGNVEILKENKLIQVKINEKIFKVDLIEQRMKKS